MMAIVGELCSRKDGSFFGVCGDCSHLDKVGDTGTCSALCRCGLTGETLDEDELAQICVNFESVDG
jgi:hypothetical protein